MKTAKFFKGSAYFFEALSSKPKTGGLEVLDSSLQFVLFKKGQAATFSVKLAPGVMKEGVIQDREKFAEALLRLHEMVTTNKDGEIVQVVVSLPAVVVYTQNFNIPNLGKEKFEEAASLNLQMVSPIAAGEAYLDSQILNEASDHYELLGAVVEKKILDDIKNELEKINFSVIVFEFPALALTRVVASAMRGTSEPVLIFRISSDGLNLMIERGGSLYFDYFTSWRSIQGDSREIPKSVFESAVIQEVQKVVNFSLSRFKENLKEILILAPGFEEEIKKMLQERFNIAITPFRLSAYGELGVTWYAALGSALRSVSDRNKDEEITLGVEGSTTLFYREQVLNFIRLWRNIFVGALGGLLVIVGGSAVYLANQSKDYTERLKSVRDPSAQPEFTLLNEKAGDFNNLVEAIGVVKRDGRDWYQFFARFQELTDGNRIIIDWLEIGSLGLPINMLAHAPNNEIVLKFKNILEAEPTFIDINLPLERIVVLEDGSVSFYISFQVKQ